MLQTFHAVLPKTTHDEFATQQFVEDFKKHLAKSVAGGCKLIYEERVKPHLVERLGGEPNDRNVIRRAMSEDQYYRMWSALHCNGQRMMWDSVITSVERQLPDLVETARKFRDNKDKLGSLTLDSGLVMPTYLTAVDIHQQPGNYYTENTEDDVAAGATYDRGVYVYLRGGIGPLNDDQGRRLMQYVTEKFPDLKVENILDMGCTVGHGTLPWLDAYPNAKVHAIDVAAPCLRYAHARAESLGKAVHFSQENAEATNFPSESFDLVVSHILLHETSTAAVLNIFKECFRLLKPGGLMAHVEIPQDKDMEIFESSQMDWETYNNNEPFLATMRDMDFEATAIKAGFNPEKVELGMSYADLPAARRDTTGGRLYNPVVLATK